jgi:hypothetical protein
MPIIVSVKHEPTVHILEFAVLILILNFYGSYPLRMVGATFHGYTRYVYGTV